MTDNLKQQLAQAETTVTITPTPLIMEKVGDTFRGVYLGQATFKKLDEKTGEIVTKPVAHFYDGDKVVFNMGAQLIGAVQRLRPGISVQIVLAELKANKHSGKTKIYAVTPLAVERIDLMSLFGGLLQITAPLAEDLVIPNDHAQIAPPQTTDQYDSMGEEMVGARSEAKLITRNEAKYAWNTVAATAKKMGLNELVDSFRPAKDANADVIVAQMQGLAAAIDEGDVPFA